MMMIFNLLRILDEAGIDNPVSGQVLSERLNISKTTVWKSINILRDIGYDIQASPDTGYSLHKRTWMLIPYEIRQTLKTRTIGQEMHHFGSVTSTNELARQMMNEIGNEVQSGTVLIAEEQTEGVGHLHRAWISPRGGIWATIVLKPELQAEKSFILMASVSIALAKAIKKECKLTALIRWPNEVFIANKKVAGTALELSTENNQINYYLVGIGINANIPIQNFTQNLTNIVTSLSYELGHEINRAQLVSSFLKEFERRYTMILKDETEPILREWKSLSNTLHRRVLIRTMHEGFEGQAMDITEKGELLVHRDNGDVEQVIVGDCIVLK